MIFVYIHCLFVCFAAYTINIVLVRVRTFCNFVLLVVLLASG